MKYDLSEYQRITVHPVTGALGAEIEGVDISKPLEKPLLAEIRRALLNHHVLFFRDQQFDTESFARFGETFAPLFEPIYLKAVPGHQFVHKLIREADVPSNLRNVGDRWHSDFSPRECPTFGFALYCLDAPPYGGDTIFANLCLAYDALSDGMKALCERLVVIHSAAGMFGRDGAGGGDKKAVLLKGMENTFAVKEEGLTSMSKETEHPLIRIHPESGRRILYITGEYCIRFKDMTESESRPLIDFLNNHAVKPEFTCRFRWRKGSVVLLDNRCTQHYAINDYAGFRREMLRVEMTGDRPFGPAMPLRTDNEPQKSSG
jgi:taurine dioxygenase